MVFLTCAGHGAATNYSDQWCVSTTKLTEKRENANFFILRDQAPLRFSAPQSFFLPRVLPNEQELSWRLFLKIAPGKKYWLDPL